MRVEARPDAAADGAREASGRRLVHEIKSRIGITAGVEVVPPGAVERSVGKARRIVDLR